jgi:hypothetical protein
MDIHTFIRVGKVTGLGETNFFMYTNYLCFLFFQYFIMKRFFSGLVIASLLVGLVACGSSRRGYGCPGNPMNYRSR